MDKKLISSVTIADINAVTKTNMARGTVFTRENRIGSAFALKKCGRTVYRQDGVKTVSDPGHITFLPESSNYEFVIEEIGECLIFEISFVAEMPFGSVTALPLISSGDAFLAAEKAEKCWTYKKPGYRHKCMGYLYDILSRVDVGRSTYINSKKYSIIEPSIKYIEEKLSDPDINTEMLARMSGVSVPYFRKLFYEFYKMPVAKYIESIRISKARDLLKTDYSSVGYIAEYVGYRNIYHFSKAFKKVTGMSPSDFSRGHSIK